MSDTLIATKEQIMGDNFVQPIQPDKPNALEAALRVEAILNDDYPDYDWYFALENGRTRFNCETVIDDKRIGFSQRIENALLQSQNARTTAAHIAQRAMDAWNEVK